MAPVQETWVKEVPLEKRMATTPSILAWRIPWAEEPGGLQFMGLQRVRHDSGTNTYTVAVLGLHRFVQLFSSCAKWERLSSCSARASHCGPSMGFSRQEYWSGVPLLKSD